MIAHSIQSVLAQSIQDLEILVVGDGAPEATEATVLAIADTDPRVRWFGFDGFKRTRAKEKWTHHLQTEQTESKIGGETHNLLGACRAHCGETGQRTLHKYVLSHVNSSAAKKSH